MANYAHLPVPGKDAGLQDYLAEIRKFPILTAEEEYKLGKRFEVDGDLKAAHQLVSSHLRLAARVANDYRGYGLPLPDLISEANIGLMMAVKRFKPDKGFRLATYAIWWIRAQVQEFIIKTFSMVKLGTTAAQKKLFFNLKKTLTRVGVIDGKPPTPDQIRRIAEILSVSENDVVQMYGRLSGHDSSLNARVGGEEEGGIEHQDMLVDENSTHVEDYAEQDELSYRRNLLNQAMDILNEREKDIFIQRRLKEPTSTLEVLSQKYGVSRERIRQIENRAYERVTERVHEIDQGNQAQLPAD